MSAIKNMECKTASMEQYKADVLKANKPPAQRAKIFKANPGDASAIAIMPDSIDISVPDGGDVTTAGISVVAERGTIIKGDVGFTGTPDQIRMGFMWSMNPLILSGMPSTIISPIPMMKLSLPLEGIMEMALLPSVIAAMSV